MLAGTNGWHKKRDERDIIHLEMRWEFTWDSSSMASAESKGWMVVRGERHRFRWLQSSSSLQRVTSTKNQASRGRGEALMGRPLSTIFRGTAGEIMSSCEDAARSELTASGHVPLCPHSMSYTYRYRGYVEVEMSPRRNSARVPPHIKHRCCTLRNSPGSRKHMGACRKPS